MNKEVVVDGHGESSFNTPLQNSSKFAVVPKKVKRSQNSVRRIRRTFNNVWPRPKARLLLEELVLASPPAERQSPSCSCEINGVCSLFSAIDDIYCI